MNKPIVVNMLAGPGCGKCFVLNTEILMYDGSIKKVQNINIGDEVMGDDSTPRLVLNTTIGSGEMFDIVPTKGNTFRVNASHVLVLSYTHHCPEKIIESTVEEYLQFNKTKKFRSKLCRSDGISFRHSEVELEPYFIGCWLGDGTNTDQSVTASDNEVLNYLNDYAVRLNMFLHKKTKKNNKSNTYYITHGQIGGQSNFVLNCLRDLNLLNNKHIPEIYKINSRSVRLKVLAGLLDTDGDMSNNCFGITTKYERLAKDITFLCRSLGLSCYYSPCRKGCIKKDGSKFIGDYFRLSISGELNEVPVKLVYKKAGCRRQIKNVLRTGFEVVPAGVGDYYGFEVDGNHKFLLSDFTITHNSTTAAGVFSLLKMHGVNAELITEFAKDLTWEKRFKTLNDQIYVWGKQRHRMWRVKDHVDVMVTDSPLLFGLIYGKKNPDCFNEMILHSFNTFDSMNYFLLRKKPYNPKGRIQTEEESKQLDGEISTMLYENNIEFEAVGGDYNGVNYIAKQVLRRLGKKMEISLNWED